MIDWTNAQAGDPALDLALTWIIAATSGSIPGRVFAHIYLRHVDVAAARRGLPAAAEFRVTDPNVTPAERERVRRLLR